MWLVTQSVFRTGCFPARACKPERPPAIGAPVAHLLAEMCRTSIGGAHGSDGSASESGTSTSWELVSILIL
jgi:hypothetical protein